MSHTFYKTKSLTLPLKVGLLQEVYTASTDYHFDFIDTAISMRRNRTYVRFEDAMNILDESCHFVVIHRRSPYDDEEYGEVGFCTMIHYSEYFMFIYLKLDNLRRILEKYKLEEMS